MGANYRGVHLTPQISKIVERTAGSLFLPWLEHTEAYGVQQFAYAKGRGYKDVLAINTLEWLLLLEKGFAVGVYCSDVSGAFDRVSRLLLNAKLRRLGLHPSALSFLESWLEDRWSQVVLGGAASLAEVLANSVCQQRVPGGGWCGRLAARVLRGLAPLLKA